MPPHAAFDWTQERFAEKHTDSDCSWDVVRGRNFRESRLRSIEVGGLGTTDICGETATSRASTSFVR
jgi:hypothetical protein